MVVRNMDFETVLLHSLDGVTNSEVKDAMLYSLMAGGKRIRPMLLYEVLKGYGLQVEDGHPFACALEMIHTYSLIHDDLPAMDNDDLRRGKPTCHKQFDEATAILAGDGLLTYAFEYASSSSLDAKDVVKAISILAKMAGPSGMVYGQCLDMQQGDVKQDFAALKEVHFYKTGCLLSIPMMIGATLAKQSEAIIEEWHTIGTQIGLAFQIQDDVFDVTKTVEELGKTNSDSRNDKVTCVTLLGLEQSIQMMNDLYEDSKHRIQNIGGFESEALLAYIETIQQRIL